MSTPKDKLTKFNFFSSLKLNNPKEQETIQESIKEDKEHLLNFFDKQPYFKEMMPIIKKASRGTAFYKGLIRNGLKNNSVFFQVIMKSIKKLNDDVKMVTLQKTKEETKLYKLPKIEELKIKKNKIDDIQKKKIKLIQLEKNKMKALKEQYKKQIIPFTTVRRKSPLVSYSSTINIFNNRYNQSNNTTNNSFNKNGNTIENYEKNIILTPIHNDISTYYKSNNTFKNLTRNRLFSNYMKYYNNSKSTNNISTNLIDKCQEEITNGKELEELLSDYNRNFMKSVQEKLDNNKLINRDHKIIEEKNKKKDKYIQLEEHNYAYIKRKMNAKISNSFAYRNRKELKEILKINKNAESYILHLNEINKINEKMGKRRIIERKRIDKVNSLCDEGFKKNENLKNKIDIINIKNLKLNKSKDYLFNDNFIINKEHKNNIYGNLVPKLMLIKLANEKQFLSIPD